MAINIPIVIDPFTLQFYGEYYGVPLSDLTLVSLLTCKYTPERGSILRKLNDEDTLEESLVNGEIKSKLQLTEDDNSATDDDKLVVKLVIHRLEKCLLSIVYIFQDFGLDPTFTKQLNLDGQQLEKLLEEYPKAQLLVSEEKQDVILNFLEKIFPRKS